MASSSGKIGNIYSFYTLKLTKDSDGMGIKILIVVTCSSGIMKVNIAVLTKLNLEARFVAYLLFLII